MQFKRIAVDTSKATFTVHGVDAEDRPILRQNLSRAQFEAFCRKLAPTELVLEACGGSHHWGRLLQSCGHTVRLIPPQYVKPFVKRGKNDRNDAAAISEAASRPDMRSVPVKPLASQAEAVDLSVRDLLIRQRTQLVNAMRGHAAEFGIIAARGIAQVGPLLDKIAGSEIPQAAKDALAQLGQCIEDLDDHRAAVDQRLTSRHKANSVSQRLAAVPGVGPITALTLAMKVDPSQFSSARHFVAWLGLTPKERSTGGRQRLGGISRAGNERLRQLLVLGATAVIRHAKPESRTPNPWLLKLLERRPRKLAAVALANKMARILWAMMANNTAYRRMPQVA
ncbi:MAG: IS110 family transposase [Janthinobacterium lividum]